MRVVTASEMREIDRRAIEECGVPSLDLMERAGAGAAQVIASSGLAKGDKVVVLCGKGNNGGDGFVAARYLRDWGADVTCWTIGERDELSSDALRNLVTAEDNGVKVRPFRPGETDDEIITQLAEAKVAVDALLGTGAAGRLRDPIRSLTRLLNLSPARVYALDMPTGMNADSGEVDPDCVRSAMTITFGFPKRGLYTLPGRDLCGDITVVDLGYPESLVEPGTGVLLWQDVRGMLPYRDPRGHKGTFGLVVVIAGSRGMIGAACLAAEAALRSGAGLVKLLVPNAVADLCATKLTEVMVHGLPSTKAGTFSAEAVAAAMPFVDEADAVLLGPGLSSAAPAQRFVRSLLPRIDKPLVLDADGLNALRPRDRRPWAQVRSVPAILTPHPGELSRLINRRIREIVHDTTGIARDAAARFGCELILKGAPSAVASPDGIVDLCSLGNDGMATGGSGDVLSGLLAGLLAQGYDAGTAARVGVMVHGRAGDLCRTELGRRGMIAGDILRCIPYAWRELEAPEESDDSPSGEDEIRTTDEEE
ncbi:MAG: NAD(P)H-hydrate dehydratase [bacterium]